MTSTLQHPTTTYAVAGRYNVNLRTTDPTGFTCTGTRIISIAAGPPVWIEIPPMIWLRQPLTSVAQLFNL
jgi:PKD repeat protein